jgi:hypothetical protein
MEKGFKYFFTLTRTCNLTHHHAKGLLSPDITIALVDEDEGGQYIFASYHLNKTENIIEAWGKAKSLLSMYNGANRVFYFDPKPVADYISIYSNDELQDMYQSHEDAFLFSDNRHSKITPYEKGEITQIEPFDDSIDFIQKRKMNPAVSPVTHSIFLAKTNPDVCSLLLLVGNNLDWISLYSILDTLKYYETNFDAFLATSGCSKTSVSKFTGTANNFGLLGVSARHGERGWAQPQQTMNLKEAQSLILGLCRSYLLTKYKVKA